MLSKSVVAGFEKYRLHDNPLFFAVTVDGRSFHYNTCPAFQCKSGSETLAINNCETRTGKECKIFAYGRDIVWKGPITYPKTRAGNYLLNIAVKDGVTTRNSVGSAILSHDKTKLNLKIKIKGSNCSGIANLKTSKWDLSCKYPKKQFHGTFHPETKSKYEGIGRRGDGVVANLLIPNPTQGEKMQEAHWINSNAQRALQDRACRHCNLEGANLFGLDLKGVDLQGVNLKDADLRNANLQNAQLRFAHLEGANLAGANLKGVDLQNSDLKGANFDGADIRGANFTNATGGDFSGVIKGTITGTKTGTIEEPVTETTSNRDICNGALAAGIPLRWDAGSFSEKFVIEAHRRDLTLHRCAELVARKYDINAMANLSNLKVCSRGIRDEYWEWIPNETGEAYRQEAEKRGLTLKQCIKLKQTASK